MKKVLKEIDKGKHTNLRELSLCLVSVCEFEHAVPELSLRMRVVDLLH